MKDNNDRDRLYDARSDYRNSNSNRNDSRQKNDNDRGWWDRAGDEVLSWMGDDYATRRRRHDDYGLHRGKGPKNYVRGDDRIRDDVNDRLTDEYNVDASDIEVSVVNGEVILKGFVLDRFQKRRAEEVAEHVTGVKHVENRIKVDPAISKNNVNLIP
jgi:osmotically-inducible protein OsmY